MPFSPSSLIPSNEEDRLLALSRYQVVGTAPESLFDDLAALTAKLFRAPIALVSLVEEDSVWFKANFGLPDAGRVRRSESLCSVAVLHNEATVFENLSTNPCTLIEPGVQQALRLEFYAGYPLQTSDGFNIGSLCVIDHQTRAFSSDEQELLRQLATTVMLLLELRRLGITLLAAAGQPYLSVPSLVHSLTMLAEIGSSGAAVDIAGNPVGALAIHHEAAQLTTLLNRTIAETLVA
ncbi:GAF domain-containing protein [Hymenobacter chitinivorans]|uniref:GAF domain-containing protein n=1 Tax=Hymenobacter chitinivorans DSM 11115 TaxID=1121954 RepID=A0A2M9BT98_9BACT|nr:GAF domain-containing protein [Hymenobacter chitinivorans]PJJ61176.1 GAF domain-containing protein [Hymenobacter chitinivorans DSM 11115]